MRCLLLLLLLLFLLLIQLQDMIFSSSILQRVLDSQGRTRREQKMKEKKERTLKNTNEEENKETNNFDEKNRKRSHSLIRVSKLMVLRDMRRKYQEMIWEKRTRFVFLLSKRVFFSSNSSDSRKGSHREKNDEESKGQEMISISNFYDDNETTRHMKHSRTRRKEKTQGCKIPRDSRDFRQNSQELLKSSSLPLRASYWTQERLSSSVHDDITV